MFFTFILGLFITACTFVPFETAKMNIIKQKQVGEDLFIIDKPINQNSPLHFMNAGSNQDLKYFVAIEPFSSDLNIELWTADVSGHNSNGDIFTKSEKLGEYKADEKPVVFSGNGKMLYIKISNTSNSTQSISCIKINYYAKQKDRYTPLQITEITNPSTIQ